MTREQTIECIKVMQGYVDGKELEILSPFGKWERATAPRWQWDDTEYRIKPTAKLRPWTADEVPLGAWVLEKANRERRWLITDVHDQEFRSDLLKLYEHSTDGGKNWLPCGVVEEAK
jgi:hypothetical protein